MKASFLFSLTRGDVALDSLSRDRASRANILQTCPQMPFPAHVLEMWEPLTQVARRIPASARWRSEQG